MARLVLGGKNGDEIRFSGDKQRLPPHIRRIVNQYFSFGFALSDYSAYPSLLAELGDARADRFFAGTDWEALQKAYDLHMQRYVVLFSGGRQRGVEGPKGLRFLVSAPAHEAARPLQSLLKEYCNEGVLRDNFDVWRLEKLLRRAKGQLRFDKGFTQTLKEFGSSAVSFEESISFFRQIQAYHAEQFLKPELHSILAAYIDQVHTLRQPLDCSEVVAKLHVAGAHVRIHPSVKPVLEHYEELKRLTGTLEAWIAGDSAQDGARDIVPYSSSPKPPSPDYAPRFAESGKGFWRRRLPHFDQPHAVQFVTFRLADSLPLARLAELRAASKTKAEEYDKVAEWLDKGHGACWLRNAEVAAAVEESILHSDGVRYNVLAYVIMPNHVHLLLEMFPGHELPEVIGSIKRWSAKSANQILGRSGAFWQPEYFDRYMRSNDDAFEKAAYIHYNPVKAGLVKKEEQYRWSSAWAGDRPKITGQCPALHPEQPGRPTEDPVHDSEPPLKVRLYPFQREGVAFLVGNRRALLADDMGLGKTLQSMSAALWLKQQGKAARALIVCPASLKYQWQAEIQRFTGLRSEVIGGGPDERESIYRAAGVFDRAREAAAKSAPKTARKPAAQEAADALLDEILSSRPSRPQQLPGIFHDPADMPFFYIVNYELVHRDIEQLKGLAPDILILDEAQRVKNFRTKTAQSVFSITSPYLFVLTGTPLENQLMELYTIMKFIEPRALGANPLAFRDRYVILDRFGGIQGYQKVEEVTRKIAALTLRRTKTQTLTELPPLIEMERWLSLTDIQRALYKELQGETSVLLSKEQWDKLATSNAMTLLQRLREVCDTPELIEPSQRESQKLTELNAILEDEIRSLDRQAIIFTQWTRMGEILLRELGSAGYSVSFLHGGVDAQGRRELVERFQAGKSRILVSTDAGGTGLNLQAASLVVNYDLPFNPAKLAQRIARAHRMGQQGSVVVINLLCRNTVEEKLVKLLKEKQGLFDDVFGDISDPSQVKPSAQLSLRELLKELVS
ncbi:transposase [bacterium]|nr:transposase [bacterium]